MDLPSKFVAAGAMALALLASVRAQTDAAPETKAADSGGLLGRSYWFADAGAMRVRNDVAQPNGVVAGTGVNLPIDDGFDYHLEAAYDRASTSLLKVQDLALKNSVTYYYRTKVVTPYVLAGFGYDQMHNAVNHVHQHANGLVGDAGTGFEVPVAKSAAVRLGVDYEQNFRKPHPRTLGYGVTGNYWFNDTVGATLGATLSQGRSGAHDTVRYVAGVNLSFD